jgi:ABC-type lipoprotein release transport system permease subunit
MSSSFQLQLNILDYGLSSLWRKRLRNLSVFLVFSFVIFLLGSFQFLSSSLTGTADTLLQTVPDITVQRLSAGRQIPLLTTSPEKLGDIFGIKSIRQRIWGYYFDESNGANYTVMGLDLDSEHTQLSLTLAQGQYPAENGRGTVILGQGVLESLKLGTRNSFSLFRPDLSLASFQRVGLFDESSNLLTSDLILMSLSDARDLFGYGENQITDLLIEVANPDETLTIAKKISEAIDGSRVLTKDQILQTYGAIFGWRSGFGSACLLAGLVAFVILAWDKGLGLSDEDRKEVGILKVLGWQTGDIMRLRFYESLSISLVAFLVGVTLAWCHLLFWDCALLRPVFLGWSVIRTPLDIVPFIEGRDILLLFSISVLPYLAATAIPAWRSAIVKPDSVV